MKKKKRKAEKQKAMMKEHKKIKRRQRGNMKHCMLIVMMRSCEVPSLLSQISLLSRSSLFDDPAVSLQHQMKKRRKQKQTETKNKQKKRMPRESILVQKQGSPVRSEKIAIE